MQKTIQTEEKIIEAAKHVFLKNGLEKAKMQEIADVAGISRTSLNYYFRTKENLFYGLLDQIFDSLIPKIGILANTPGNLLSKLETVVDIYFDMMKKNPFIPKFIFIEIQRNPDTFFDFVTKSEKAQKYLSLLSNLIDSEANEGKISPKSTAITVCTFFGITTSPFLLKPLLQMYWDNEEVFMDQYKQNVKKIMYCFFE